MEYSKYYKTFANILQIRTVSAEYLVAMKLMAGRQYKNDLSDIVGVLIEQENKDVLVGFQEDYPGVLNGDNLAGILKAARAKKQQYR